MRIALISPFSRLPMRGNITTVRRIERFLGRAGSTAVTLAADTLSPGDMEQGLAAFRPDVIHGFHAYHSGVITRLLAERLRIPFVLTITGSDIHDPLLRSHPDTVNAIEAAQGVVCFNASDAEQLAEYVPQCAGKISIVPQGVEPLPCVEGNTFGLDHEAFVLLLPAALRPVKRVEFPVQLLPELLRHDPSLRLVIAGGVIDREYAATINRLLCDTPCATWIGEVPHEQMGILYRRAGLVLNCSRSESMPNSVMEAMALGRPVLAADIPGNRSMVKHGETGWLYEDEEDFKTRVLEIRGDKALRDAVGIRAEEFMRVNYSPEVEAERYLAIYRELV